MSDDFVTFQQAKKNRLAIFGSGFAIALCGAHALFFGEIVVFHFLSGAWQSIFANTVATVASIGFMFATIFVTGREQSLVKDDYRERMKLKAYDALVGIPNVATFHYDEQLANRESRLIIHEAEEWCDANVDEDKWRMIYAYRTVHFVFDDVSTAVLFKLAVN